MPKFCITLSEAKLLPHWVNNGCLDDRKNYQQHLPRIGNNYFASDQVIRAASYAVLCPSVHGSFSSRTQKRSLCGLAASSGGRTREMN